MLWGVVIAHSQSAKFLDDGRGCCLKAFAFCFIDWPIGGPFPMCLCLWLAGSWIYQRNEMEKQRRSRFTLIFCLVRGAI